MGFSNKDSSAVGINRCDTASRPTDLAELVSDNFSELHVELGVQYRRHLPETSCSASLRPSCARCVRADGSPFQVETTFSACSNSAWVMLRFTSSSEAWAFS